MQDATNTRKVHTGTSALSSYAYDYKIFDESHLLVTLTDLSGDEIELALGDDYDVTGSGEAAGGTIELVNAGQSWLTAAGNLITGYGLLIRRVPPITQLTEFKNQDDYYPEVHEDALDLAVHVAQSVKDYADRSIKAMETEDVDDLILPPVAERAGKILAFDDDGKPTVTTDPLGDGVIVSPFMETVLDDTTAADARTTLGFAGVGGTAQAANIEADAVTTNKILDAAVTTPKLADEAVTTPKIYTRLIDAMTIAPAELDDYVALADTSDSNLNKKALVSTITNIIQYRAVSADYDAVTSDGILDCSGAAFIITLYTAVGNAGRVIELIHNGTSLTQYYGIATQGSETVGGFSGSGTAYRLVTNGEVLRLRSDGANWLIVAHHTVTEWVTSGTVGIGGSTTAPTKGTATIYVDEMWWRRVGDSAEIRFAFRKTANGTATAGSGDYIFQVPSGMVINTSRGGTDENTAEGTGLTLLKKSAVGFGAATVSGIQFDGMFAVFDSTGVTLAGMGTTTAPAINHNTVCSAAYSMTNADVSYRGFFTVPISTWKA